LRRFGFHRVLPIGAVVSAILIAGFALLTPETPHWVIAVYVVLFGIARSAMFMGTNALAYADIAPAELSRATSLGGVVQQLSISFGVSAAALLLAWVSDEKGLTIADFHEAFMLIAILPLAAVIGFSRLRPEDGAVALANKMARMIWAMMVTGERYREPVLVSSAEGQLRCNASTGRYRERENPFAP
jgi:hypothetical protein